MIPFPTRPGEHLAVLVQGELEVAEYVVDGTVIDGRYPHLYLHLSTDKGQLRIPWDRVLGRFTGLTTTRQGFTELMRRASNELVIAQLVESASKGHEQEVILCRAELLRRLQTSVQE